MHVHLSTFVNPYDDIYIIRVQLYMKFLMINTILALSQSHLNS